MRKLGISYQCHPGEFCWYIPFAYGQAADIGVSLILPDGTEQRLEYTAALTPEPGQWSLIEHCVHLRVDSPCSLQLWLDRPLDYSLAANQARLEVGRSLGLAATHNGWDGVLRITRLGAGFDGGDARLREYYREALASLASLGESLAGGLTDWHDETGKYLEDAGIGSLPEDIQELLARMASLQGRLSDLGESQ